MILSLASLSLLAAPFAEPGVRLEMHADGTRYRLVVQTPRALSFEARYLEKPSYSLSPTFTSLEVVDRAGKPILCSGAGPADGDGRYRSAVISSNLYPVLKHPPMIRVRSRFTSEWYEAAALFAGFEWCASQPDRRQWASYRIHVELPTSIGTLSTRSDWIAVRTPIF